MPRGIVRKDGSVDWQLLESAAREVAKEVNFDRALNIDRKLPAIALYGKTIEDRATSAIELAIKYGGMMERITKLG